MILPAWGQMPGSEGLNLEADMLDMTLSSRPDLCEPLTELLEEAGPQPGEAWLLQLQQRAPDRLRMLVTMVCAVYYQHPEVRKLLGYPGQEALTLSRGGFGAEELVLKMMESPKRFRNPTG